MSEAAPAVRRDLSRVSVVAPLYNEEETVRAFCERVFAALEPVGVDLELVLVDDGSTDATAAILAELAAADPRIKGILFSRNFGHQIALTAGIDHADGDAVVTLDADLQDPPELIPAMLDCWRRGSDVVYAVRGERHGEGPVKLRTKRFFYWLFGRLAQIEFAHDSGDFRLLDRRVLEALGTMREHNRFLRGMTVWVGFTQTAIPYTRDRRYAGTAKYTLGRLVRLAFDGMSSFSYVPLQLATWLGFLFSLLAFLGIPVIVVLRLLGIYLPGFASITIVVLFLSGIQLVALGVMGEYIGRIYDEVRGRPLYIVRGRLNALDACPRSPGGPSPDRAIAPLDG